MVTSQIGFTFADEQFRMTRLQVYNWGTFHGLYDIPISTQGFLFTGPSGGGKSTLLDAISALLVPPRWVDFNAAAREAQRARRDRSLVTYVRGAWGGQQHDDSGEIATQYLRPGATWSALALTYANPQGRRVSLVQLFWIASNSNAHSDVKRQYFVFEREVALTELESFGLSNFDIRRLKQQLDDAQAYDTFPPYADRFRRLLGIESEAALRLLHKTQSAKNLGDLNTFLREFMLDRPQTFEIADRLVTEFGDLKAAHQAVVTARRQIETLVPARTQHAERERLQAETGRLQELIAGQHSYRESLRLRLLTEREQELAVQADGLAAQLQQQQAVVANEERLLRELQQQHREQGGGQIERLEDERREKEQLRAAKAAKRQQAVAATTALGWVLPNEPAAFAALVERARQEVADWETARAAADERRDELASELRAVRAELAETEREVEALRRQPSNIPAHMLRLRDEMAATVGLSPSALPFVGELIDVRPEEAAWRGAIERVLHNFALSLLVPERSYAAVAAYVNDTHFGQRVVYYRAGAPDDSGVARTLSPESLVSKLGVREDSPYAPWLQAELQRRFDYACVDSIHAFRQAERAVTVTGQVKHNRYRHEKDDRHRIDDRRRWVLGFDNREKLALYVSQAAELREREEALATALAELRRAEQERGERVLQAHVLTQLQWDEIDVTPLVQRIRDIDRLLAELQAGNSVLQELGRRIKEQEDKLERARKAAERLAVKEARVRDELAEVARRRAEVAADPARVPLTPTQQEGLAQRYLALGKAATVENVDALDREVGKWLQSELDQLMQQIYAAEREIERALGAFCSEWPAEAGGLSPTIDFAPDFFAKLQRLETDGLPAYEDRFFELLQTQSNRNLLELNRRLSQGRKDILARMDIVNDSLRQVPFNQDGSYRTYLQIETTDRHLPAVREFRQELHAALHHVLGPDREGEEQRFLAMQRLVERLASQENADRRWRETVLDVRQHVEFIGRELDEAGAVVEVYQSGAGKSGGQRQKLTTTCLAAALRYQLGGNNHGLPLYAAVVLDEAFDKADNEFTALAMQIFVNFGFQMIIATPLKSVMTLEPFIGGGAFIGIRDRRRSSALILAYDGELQRLDLPGRGGRAETANAVAAEPSSEAEQ